MGSTHISSKTLNLGHPYTRSSKGLASPTATIVTACVFLLSIALSADAQGQANSVAPVASTPSMRVPAVHVAKPAQPIVASVSGKQDWNELTAAQRQALSPLAGDWGQLDAARRKKWLEIARRYPAMKPDEQQRTQQRMREWILLTPEQRRTARDSYVRAHALPPEKRAELLQKYQQLPEEKKQQLAAEAKAHKSVIRAKPEVTHQGPIPSKAQIREGSKQKVPGLPTANESAHSSLKKPINPSSEPSKTASTPIPPVSGSAANAPTPISTPSVSTPAKNPTTATPSTVVLPPATSTDTGTSPTAIGPAGKP